MSSKIIELINYAIKNEDQEICSLFENDPLFAMIYRLLHQIGEDSPSIILGFIVSVCSQRMEALNRLQSICDEKPIIIIKDACG